MTNKRAADLTSNMSSGASATEATDGNSVAAKAKTKYTPAEVANHDKEDDCWIVVDNNVYDVTSFVAEVPTQLWQEFFFFFFFFFSDMVLVFAPALFSAPAVGNKSGLYAFRITRWAPMIDVVASPFLPWPGSPFFFFFFFFFF